MKKKIDVTLKGNLRTLQQPKDGNVCWAIVATIMHSWKTDSNPSVRSVIESIDNGLGFLGLFDDNLPLEVQDSSDFLVAMELIAEPPQSFGVQGIADLLSNHGPIWVTADEDVSERFSGHARVVIGLKGDGTPRNTFATIIDPNLEELTLEPIELLQEKFSQLAIGDAKFGGSLAQFIHY